MEGSTDVVIRFHDNIKMEGSCKLPEGRINISAFDSQGNIISFCDKCGLSYVSIRSYHRNPVTGIAEYSVQRCKHLPEDSRVTLFVDPKHVSNS